jgi:hypothetical protein
MAAIHSFRNPRATSCAHNRFPIVSHTVGRLSNSRRRGLAGRCRGKSIGGSGNSDSPSPLFFRYNLSNFLSTALSGKCLLDTFLLARLQIKRVFLHFLDDVFLLNFSFKTPQRILNGFSVSIQTSANSIHPGSLKIDPILFLSLQSDLKPCAILRRLWRAVPCVRSVPPNGSAPPKKPVSVLYVADRGGKSTLTAQAPVII